MSAPKVLVVEDDPLLRWMLATVLESQFDVLKAASASAAIALLKDPLHAVLTDYDLGAGSTGEAVLRAARRAVPNTRLILMSGRDSVRDEVPGWLWDKWISKPVDTSRLFAMLVG